MYVMALPHASESWRWMLSNLWWSKQAKLIDSQFWKLEKTKPNTLQKTRWLPSRKPSHSIGFLEHIPIKRPCIRTDVGCFHIQKCLGSQFHCNTAKRHEFCGQNCFCRVQFYHLLFCTHQKLSCSEETKEET